MSCLGIGHDRARKNWLPFFLPLPFSQTQGEGIYKKVKELLFESYAMIGFILHVRRISVGSVLEVGVVSPFIIAQQSVRS